MRHNGIRVAAALALIYGGLAATPGMAARLDAVPESETLVTPARMPLGLSNRTVTVVVQLAGDPVAVQQGNAGRKLSAGEKESIKAQLKAAQNNLRGGIGNLGGTVVADYQSAYNGMKVRISRDKVDQLATLPNVVAVRPVQLMRPDNTNGVPFIGTPGVWQSLGLHGEGVKIAIIDSGIDYTHANFGGPGTKAAYATAHASATASANPLYFGPGAPRVKGGIDLVGDNYDAGSDDPARLVPHPDANPLDCDANGHGSHVAGTAAGSGVTAAGATYTGPYNLTTIPSNAWTIGPGVAPKAELYAVRVFGCEGSTDVTVDAIDWAVDHDMDVINMSLGSVFGTNDDPSAEASSNAAKAGVIVVASAGNSGPNQYITGSPATADGAIAVAANDARKEFPGATITLPSGTITAINANGYAFSGPVAYTIKVITDNPATATTDESLGCSVADFGGPLPPNTIAVVNRGVCARVAKAIFGQQAGAAAVVMVNNAAGLPPFEGKITSNPDDGTPFLVTIPFLGVAGPPTGTTDGAKLRAANGFATTVTPVLIANPAYAAFASFSSGGPRRADSNLKPDITAPGVSVLSTLVGSGNEGTILSGTSMSSPHVAGVAALTRQAHPTWKVQDIKAAIVNTGLPSGVANYRTSLGGTGLVQPAGSTKAQVIARANDAKLGIALNFGFQELTKDFSQKKAIKLSNNTSQAARFNVSQAVPSGSPHSVTFDKTSITVPANGDAEVTVALDVPVATAGASNGAGLSFHEVSGIVQFTPATASDNAGIALRVPYYLVPRPLSNVSTDIGSLKGTNPTTTATVTNKHGAIAGDADFYAWGIESKNRKGQASHEVRAVGVQSFPNPSASNPSRRLMVFAVNTFNRWSNPSINEFDIYVDVDGDGKDDYVIVGADNGLVTTGAFTGVMNAFVFSTRSAGASSLAAVAPTDSSTALLLARTSQFCRASEPCLDVNANPRITYHVVSFGFDGPADEVAEVGKFNVWSSAISQGGFVTVAPGASDSSTPISINSAEWARTPAKGVMVVTFDNASGADEAQLIDVKVK